MHTPIDPLWFFLLMLLLCVHFLLILVLHCIALVLVLWLGTTLFLQLATEGVVLAIQYWLVWLLLFLGGLTLRCLITLVFYFLQSDLGSHRLFIVNWCEYNLHF